MARLFTKMMARLCKSRMSELGKEILPLFYEGDWEISEYKLTHKTSGVVFWIANDFGRFRLYDIKGLHYHDEAYRHSLTLADRWVFWECYLELLSRAKEKPSEAALNMVRMYKMKGEVK